MKDLKGKRIGYVKGNPSVDIKTGAQLALAGLPRYAPPRNRLRTRAQATSATNSLSASSIGNPLIVAALQLLGPEPTATASMAVTAETIAATTATDAPRMTAFHGRSKPMSRMTASAAITTEIWVPM